MPVTKLVVDQQSRYGTNPTMEGGTHYSELTPGLWYTDEPDARWYVYKHAGFEDAPQHACVAFSTAMSGDVYGIAGAIPTAVRPNAGLTTMRYYPLPNFKLATLLMESSEVL